jgi:hypothetical protein
MQMIVIEEILLMIRKVGLIEGIDLVKALCD